MTITKIKLVQYNKMRREIQKTKMKNEKLQKSITNRRGGGGERGNVGII